MSTQAEWFFRRGRRGVVPVVIGAALLLAGLAAPVRSRADLQSPGARPTEFDHRRHERISCDRCHGTGEQHRTLLLRTAADCLACHHGDAARGSECTACHERSQLPEPGTVRVSLELTVWQDSRTRDLRFGHVLHASVECRDCHGAPITLQMDRTCGSCHERHHTAAADCESCHVSPGPAVHDASAHLTCGGNGCHGARAAPAAASRSLCIVCHAAQRTHEPSGDCARCHQVPAFGTLPAHTIGGGGRR
ncbi:MAG TPA: hypothetical protein VK933_14530 [Longimicrobiales bacterium]|nr:hypothetical protein [Longimicrobiales bacterium]